MLRDMTAAVPSKILFFAKAGSALIWTAGLPMDSEYQEKFMQDSSDPGVRIILPVEAGDSDCHSGSHVWQPGVWMVVSAVDCSVLIVVSP